MSKFKTHSEKGNSIRNKLGTSELSCQCESWLEHWKTYSDSRVHGLCAVAGCTAPAEVGAHVELHKLADHKGKTYIAPMCRQHNGQHGADFLSKPGHVLAIGSVADTCGKA
jgi:hypothetical protein